MKRTKSRGGDEEAVEEGISADLFWQQYCVSIALQDTFLTCHCSRECGEQGPAVR